MLIETLIVLNLYLYVWTEDSLTYYVPAQVEPVELGYWPEVEARNPLCMPQLTLFRDAVRERLFRHFKRKERSKQ